MVISRYEIGFHLGRIPSRDGYPPVGKKVAPPPTCHVFPFLFHAIPSRPYKSIAVPPKHSFSKWYRANRSRSSGG
jgi:hypothetical protein